MRAVCRLFLFPVSILLLSGCGFLEEKPVTEEERSAFFKAAAAGEVTVLRKFIRKKSKIVEAKDSDGRTALHEAILAHKNEAVDLLLTSRATTNHRSKTVGTPLDIAISRKDEELIKKLKSWGAKPSMPNLAAMDDEQGLQFAYERGADLDETDPQGMTALHWAAARGNDMNVAMLCQYGADMQALDAKKRTPADLALESGHNRTCQMLLKYVEEKEQGAAAAAKVAATGPLGTHKDNPHPAGSAVRKNHYRIWRSGDGRSVNAKFLKSDFKGRIDLQRANDDKQFWFDIEKLDAKDKAEVKKWETAEQKRLQAKR